MTDEEYKEAMIFFLESRIRTLQAITDSQTAQAKGVFIGIILGFLGLLSIGICFYLRV